MVPPERKRAALYIVLIFLCGVFTGTAAMNLWMNWGPRSVSARADSQPRSPQRIVEKFTKELDLSPEQAKQLNDILDETHKAYREHESQIEAIRQQGRARIREILNDEQKAKYEQILAGIEQRRKARQQR
jgi:Spy/CpxP family protein refolding chaperone